MTSAKPSILPGLGATLVIAAIAQVVYALPFFPFTLEGGKHPIDTFLLAIIIGIALRNLLSLPDALGEGIKYSVQKLLPFAIVLMGAKLDFYDVMRVSGQALLINVTCVVVALSLTLALCRRAKVGQKLGILIAIGTAICGGTAIAVAAPVIEAEERDTALAVTAIALFGLLSVFAFPALGLIFGLSQADFGLWAGTAVHATPQVMAAGYAYGKEAGDIAVIVKLVRVLLLAPVVVGLGLWYGRKRRAEEQAYVKRKTKLSTLFPPFVFGFVLVALARTLHLLPDFTLHLQESPLWSAGELPVAMSHVSATASSSLITMSMAGVGLGVNLKGLGRVGAKALGVGLFATVVLAAFSLTLIRLKGGG